MEIEVEVDRIVCNCLLALIRPFFLNVMFNLSSNTLALSKYVLINHLYVF